MAEKPRPLRDYPPELWARLSPAFRAAHNRLRRARGHSPIPDPKVDLYEPPRPAASPPPPPFNPADPEAIATELEFRGLGDQLPVWKGIAEQLAFELARYRLADRRLRTEELHRAIARFVVFATKKSGKPRKVIIEHAVDIFGVSTRTVETALERWLEKEAFIDSLKI
jgi:hypothetical protein